MKIIYVHCGWSNEYRSDPRSYEHYFFQALFQLLVQTSYFHSDLWLSRENLVRYKQHGYRTRLVSSIEAVGQNFPSFTNFQTNLTFAYLSSNLLTWDEGKQIKKKDLKISHPFKATLTLNATCLGRDEISSFPSALTRKNPSYPESMISPLSIRWIFPEKICKAVS